MKKLSLFVVVLVSLGLLIGCAAPKTALKMSDLNPKFADLEKKPETNFLATVKVEYAQVGDAKFDAFFKNAASIKGTMVVATEMMKKITTDLKAFAQSLGVAGGDTKALVAGLKEKKQNFPKEKAEELKMIVENGKAVGELLVGLVAKGTQLVSDSMNMVGMAKEAAMKNPTNIKLASVPAEIPNVVTTLKDAIAQAPDLIKAFTELIEMLKDLI